MSNTINNTSMMNSDQNIEAILHLWIAANAEKSQRIETLEAECNQLRQRVARLSRQLSTNSHACVPQSIRQVK